MGENICKWSNQQGIDLQNAQTAPAAYCQKMCVEFKKRQQTQCTLEFSLSASKHFGSVSCGVCIKTIWKWKSLDLMLDNYRIDSPNFSLSLSYP